MGKPNKKELLSKAPWRGDDSDASDKFKDAKLKVTSEAGTTPTMHVPGKKKPSKYDALGDDEDSLQIDPQLRYSFQRNFQIADPLLTSTCVVLVHGKEGLYSCLPAGVK